jgi:glutathione S-transferase
MSKILTADDFLDEQADEAYELHRQREVDEAADALRAHPKTLLGGSRLSIPDAYMPSVRRHSLRHGVLSTRCARIRTRLLTPPGNGETPRLSTQS